MTHWGIRKGDTHDDQSTRNDGITLAGSLVIAVGAFMPMTKFAGLNEVGYADTSSPEVYLLIAFAVAASVLLVLGGSIMNFLARVKPDV